MYTYDPLYTYTIYAQYCTIFFSRHPSSHIMINIWFNYITIPCPNNSDNCTTCSICGRDGSWQHFYLSFENILRNARTTPLGRCTKNVFHVVPCSIHLIWRNRHSRLLWNSKNKHSNILMLKYCATLKAAFSGTLSLAAKRQLWERSGALFTPWDAKGLVLYDPLVGDKPQNMLATVPLLNAFESRKSLFVQLPSQRPSVQKMDNHEGDGLDAFFWRFK